MPLPLIALAAAIYKVASKPESKPAIAKSKKKGGTKAKTAKAGGR
jgi:hypothetical protein